MGLEISVLIQAEKGKNHTTSFTRGTENRKQHTYNLRQRGGGQSGRGQGADEGRGGQVRGEGGG